MLLLRMWVRQLLPKGSLQAISRDLLTRVYQSTHCRLYGQVLGAPARIILNALQELKMSYPKTSPERRRELQAIRKQLTARS